MYIHEDLLATLLGLLVVLTIVLTEKMLGSKKSKPRQGRIILFWIVVICMSFVCAFFYDSFVTHSENFVAVLLYSVEIFPALTILMIPARIIFELVLIGTHDEKAASAGNEQPQKQTYRSNYPSNTQNNN